jgi:hypothetical protein
VSARTHGKTNTTEFTIWKNMLARCHNANNKDFKNYGGRGIVVCDQWRGSFEMFLADVGPRPSAQHSIDRIDNNSNYEPGNCRWATRIEQGCNKRNNVMVTIDGSEKTISQWARHYGIDRRTAWRHHKEGMRGEAIFKPKARLITHNGITDSVKGWAKRTGIKSTTIAMRIGAYKWTIEQALTTPTALPSVSSTSAASSSVASLPSR